jgi:hypothetical protein
MKIGEANAPTEIAQIPLVIEDIMANSFLVTINAWTIKILDAIDRSVRTNHPVVDAQCVQAIIDGLRASSDKSRSTRDLYDKAKALSDTERPKTPEEMIDWVVTTMRNVKVAIETANLNGYVYDASFQLHYKKPGTSVMHRDLKQVGGGGKTAQKSASAATPPLCISAAIIQWMLAAERVFPIRIPTYWSNGEPTAQLARRGRTDTIATGARMDQRSPSRITRTRASKQKRKLAIPPYR